MVYSEPVDLCCHGVLECQADKLNPMLPAQATFHEAAHPSDQLAFACARKSVDQIKQWIVCGMLCRALPHLEDLYLQSANKVLQESKLLRIWRLRIFLDVAKNFVQVIVGI